jgi:hypothetical protein
MAVHFVNPAQMEIDVDQPHVLMYQLEEDGTYTLAGVEWLVPTEGLDEAPEQFGYPFDGPMPAHGELPEHYALHAWLYIENPNGMFTSYNSALVPPTWVDDMHATLGAAMLLGTDTEATAAGYMSNIDCIDDPDAGGMGVHWVNPGITTLDPVQPQVLLFEDNGGTDTLVAVEWLVPTEGLTEAPVLIGQTFDGPMPAHDDLPEHYALHMWLKANPGGMFSPFNPTVGCP